MRDWTMYYTIGDDGQHIEIVTCQTAIILPFFIINVINVGNFMCVCIRILFPPREHILFNYIYELIDFRCSSTPFDAYDYSVQT